MRVSRFSLVLLVVLFLLPFISSGLKISYGGSANTDVEVSNNVDVNVYVLNNSEMNLSDISDVNAGSPSDGQVLEWDSGTSRWIAATDDTGTSGTQDGNASSICADQEVLLGEDTTLCINLNDTIDNRVTVADTNASSCPDGNYLDGDGNCYVLNDTIDNRVGTSNINGTNINITAIWTGNILPRITEFFNIGSITEKFLNIFVANVTANNITIFENATFDSYKSCTALETDASGVLQCGSDADSGVGAGDGQKNTTGDILINDTYTIEVNSSKANETWIPWTNESNLNVNSSTYWDDINSVSGILGSLINNDLSWITNAVSDLVNYYTKTEVDNLDAGIVGTIEANQTLTDLNSSQLQSYQANLSNYDCAGTDKVVGVLTNGTIVCASDQTGDSVDVGLNISNGTDVIVFTKNLNFTGSGVIITNGSGNDIEINIIDTNVSSVCDGGQVQLGNGSCMESSEYYDDTTIADTNESIRVENMIAENCTGTDKMEGVLGNGTIICGTDESGTGGDFYHDNFTNSFDNNHSNVNHPIYNKTYEDYGTNVSINYTLETFNEYDSRWYQIMWDAIFNTSFSDRFDSLFGAKTTDDLTEGTTNKYDNVTWNETRGNELYADTNCSDGSCAGLVYWANESVLNVNSSVYWNDTKAINNTIMQNNGGTLTLVISWFTNLFIQKTGDTMTGHLDMSNKNLTTVDCVVFNSGGRMCSGT